MDDKERLSKFLAEQKYMTLAVVLDDGTPWATPVRIKTQFADGFEWDSMENTEHSKAIAKRPDIAISIWTPDGSTTEQFGFYAKARASKLADGHGKPARYHAVITKAWVNDATFVKREVQL